MVELKPHEAPAASRGARPKRRRGGGRAWGAGRREEERGRAAGGRECGGAAQTGPRSPPAGAGLQGRAGGAAGAGPEVRASGRVPLQLPGSPHGPRVCSPGGKGPRAPQRRCLRGWGRGRGNEGLCPFALAPRPGLLQEPHPARAAAESPGPSLAAVRPPRRSEPGAGGDLNPGATAPKRWRSQESSPRSLRAALLPLTFSSRDL